MSDLIHELIFKSADRAPDSDALIYQDQKISYAVMAGAIESVAAALFSLGLDRNQRLAVYLEKSGGSNRFIWYRCCKRSICTYQSFSKTRTSGPYITGL